MSVTLNAELRGDAKPNNLRTEGKITAELYGPDIKNQGVVLNYLDFERAYNEAGESSLVNLEVGGKKFNVLLSGLQVHPLTGKFIHIDLRQVSMTEKIEAEVELKFIGEPPATKSGGVFVANKNTLAIEALPNNLINELEVDISVLTDFGSKILVKDIKLPEGVIAVDEPDAVVATVSQPMAEEAPVVTAEAEKAAVESVGVEKKGKEETEEEDVAKGK